MLPHIHRRQIGEAEIQRPSGVNAQGFGKLQIVSELGLLGVKIGDMGVVEYPVELFGIAGMEADAARTAGEQ